MELYKLPHTLKPNGLTKFAFSLILTALSSPLLANKQDQTLVLIGGALTTCSSFSPQNCRLNSAPSGKKQNNYQLNKMAISAIAERWPTPNNDAKSATVKNLTILMANYSQIMNKSELLWAWRDLDQQQLNQLVDQEYNFVLDMLEQPVLDASGQRLKEQVDSAKNSERAANDILAFIEGASKVSNATPQLLAITASSRDPYETADFYEGLLSFEGVSQAWLPLTPALAKAISRNECSQLNQYREQLMGLYNREVIYPDRTAAEQALCEKGSANLVTILAASTGLMFNGGDQSLTRQVMFDEQGNEYPWTEVLRSRPIIIGTSAGTAVQSGGKNTAGQVAMISNGTSLAALREGAFAFNAPSERCLESCPDNLGPDSLTYQALGGLGTFNYGILDTHFSERNRTARLATLLSKTGQNHGFGVDETTALVVVKANKTELMTVVGKHGVVHIQTKGQQQKYNYSYWPSGTVIDITKQGFSLSSRTKQAAKAGADMPALPAQIFQNILNDAKLRSLTQAMCLSKSSQSQGQHDEFNLSISAQDSTEYVRVNSHQNGCAINELELMITASQ